MDRSHYFIEKDIIKDSVSTIMDKLFYEATCGKTIDYAWDAPQPISVNPLTEAEAADWGDLAMSTNFVRTSRAPIRLGRIPVSTIPGFAQRSTAAPFFGYKSDPPVARAFDSLDPIGPVARAIKSAGILAALAEQNAESEEPVWALLKGTFGIDVSAYKDIIKPDLSGASAKDHIKFIRSPNHMLFGFNSSAPATSPNTGKYRPETMTRNIQFDWHAMLITLRFIGENIARNYHINVPIEATIKFAPAYAEGRVYRKPTYSSNICRIKDSDVPEGMAKAVDSAMKFLQGSATRKGVLMAIRSETRGLKISIDTPVTIEAIREKARSLKGPSIILPKNVAKYVASREIAEINEMQVERFQDTIAKSVTRLKAAVPLNWRRVFCMVLAAAFHKGFPKDTVLIDCMRKHSILPMMSAKEVEALMKKISACLPIGLGFTIFCTLDKLASGTESAIMEFCMMIVELSGDEMYEMTTSYDTALTKAICRSCNPSVVLKWIQSAYNNKTSHTHGISKLLRPLAGEEDITVMYRQSLNAFLRERMAYWGKFYGSVVVRSRNRIKSMKAVAKTRKIANVPGKRMNMSDTIDYAAQEFTKLSDDELQFNINEEKAKVIMSNFSSEAYKHAVIHVSDKFAVDIKLPSTAYSDILLRQADNYARKRETWGKKLAPAAIEWKIKRNDFVNLTRISDMLKMLDDHFTPDVKWAGLKSHIEGKFDITRRSVRNLLRNNLREYHSEEFEAEKIEEVEIAEKDKTWLATNHYASLWSEDSDNDDSSTDDRKLTATKQATTVSIFDQFLSLGGDAEVPKQGVTFEEHGRDPTVTTVAAAASVQASTFDIAAFTNSMFGMFGADSGVSEPVKLFDSNRFSLRDMLKTDFAEFYDYRVYERYLAANHLGPSDYLGEMVDIMERCEEYVEFKHAERVVAAQHQLNNAVGEDEVNDDEFEIM